MQISKDKTAEAATPSRLLISKPQVLQLIGNPANSTVWGWMRAGAFPLPIVLGPPGGRSSMIAWYADEIHDWIANRPRRKLGQHEFRGRSAAEQIDTSQQRRCEPKQRRAEGARVDSNGEAAGTVSENDAKIAQARLNGIWKFKKDKKQRRLEEAAKFATPPPATSPAPSPARRDSLSGLREAARKRRGAA